MSKLKLDAALHLDSLVESLPGHTSSEIIAGLFELEMMGMVRQMPGRNFIRAWQEA